MMTSLRLGSTRAPTPSCLALWFERRPCQLVHSRDIARSYARPQRAVQRALAAFAAAGHIALVVDETIGEGWSWTDSASPAQVGAHYRRREAIARAAERAAVVRP